MAGAATKMVDTKVRTKELQLVDVTGRVGTERKVATLGDYKEDSFVLETRRMPSKMFSSHYKHFRVTIAPLKLNLTERFLREIQMSMLQIFGHEDPLRRVDYARGMYDDNFSTWSLLEYFHAIQHPWKTLTQSLTQATTKSSSSSSSSSAYKRVLIDHFRMGGRGGASMTLTFTFRPYDDLMRKAECDASLLRAGGFALPEGIPDISNPKQLDIQEVVLRSVIGESTVVSV